MTLSQLFGRKTSLRRPSHTTYEPDFVAYLQRRRGIDESAARRLVARSQEQFEGGWGGAAYRDFTERALEALRPIYDDQPADALIETYQAHAPLDFLRMLSYPIPEATEVSSIVDALASHDAIEIVDYGCGLAQRTIAIGAAVKARGRRVNVTFVDVRRPLYVDFLEFVCKRRGLDHAFVEVTAATMCPDLPAHDYCEIVNVLEHLANPSAAIDAIDAGLREGGLLLASVDDQEEEMMHISPRLGAVRDQLSALGYRRRESILEATLFEKMPRG